MLRESGLEWAIELTNKESKTLYSVLKLSLVFSLILFGLLTFLSFSSQLIISFLYKVMTLLFDSFRHNTYILANSIEIDSKKARNNFTLSSKLLEN